ncbi:MAG: aldehyde ferredoxin oxidoreductase family protein [candidate division NC10 bacterium]|nr:aldehyde ferredoxin oxidoreductase family protein [candidate division NC10 bacterium]
MFGYGGRILTVDVTNGEQRIEEFDAAFARAYLGGNGFAAKLCHDRIPPGIDPFDPRNLVVFATGPITDSVIPGNNRNCVAGKSPLNGLFFDSTFGGRFAGTQRHTGFDAIAITGTSLEPVYLVVDEGGVRLTPAKDLWGQPTLQTAQTILDREGWDSDVVSIGPAGERRVRIAALAHYWKNRESFGARGGLAAVLGSKQVKAVVVRGSRKAQFADPDLLKAMVNETREALKKGTSNLHVFGTPNLVKGINAIGGLGFFNNRFEYSPDAEQVGGERYKAEFHKKDTTCNKCPVACGKTFEVKEGEYAGTVWKMPEYESIYAFGPMLGNLDPASLIKAEELCDQLGLDTISMGVTIAFVLECLERGFLTEREVGVPVGWGNHQAVHRLVEMTARREGFGDVLAEGSARLAERLGPEARKFLHAVKGLEMPAHSARALKGMSIGYATGTRGGSHHDARPTAQYAPDFDRRNPEGKAAWAIRSQNFTAVDDSLVLCRFTSERGGYGMYLNESYVRMINAATGWDLDLAELERIGERICTLERAFNVREGVSRKDDTLPWRVQHEPIPDGPSKGTFCPPEELDRMLEEYYELRGWTKEGIPTPEKLRALGLEFAVQR